MADNSDRTVFRQPTPGGDRTMMRPSPGSRTAIADASIASVGESAPQRFPRAEGGVRPAETLREATAFFEFEGLRCLNPLLSAASTLIAVFEKTRQSISHPNVGVLHQNLVQEIRLFEQKSRDCGIRPEIVLAARYTLCSVLDEAVLNTPWGSESVWAQRTLLSVFHNETSGGEKVFLILDRLRQAPAENIHYLEFAYVLLSLGFEGRYKLQHRGRDAVEQLKDELYTTITRYRGDYERSLSPAWRGIGSTRRSLTEHMPLWVAASIFAGVLFFSYSGFRLWLHNATTPVVAQLETITHKQSSNQR